MTAALFSPLKLGNVKLQNRIVVSPMCQYSADDGAASDWHIMHIGQFAVANPGLIFLEGTAVSPDGRISEGDLCLFNDRHQDGIQRVATFVRAHSEAKLGIQLFHAGRKGSQRKPWDNDVAFGSGDTISESDGGWRLKGPSALAYSDEFPQPDPLTHEDLEIIKSDFVQSAVRADRAGVDVLELHYAHGYLLHTFLSAVSNQRSDEYGGSLEARMRYPLDVFRAVRAVWPEEKSMGARISGSDFGIRSDSWSIDDAVTFAHALKEAGAEFLDVSGGFLSPDQRFADVYGPAFQVELARRIKLDVGLPTIAVGAITNPAQAEQIITDGAADAVAIARGMLYDPRWPWRAAYALNASPQFPPQYERAFALGYPDLFNSVHPVVGD